VLRRALLVLLVGCDATVPATPPPAATYPAPAVAFDLGADRGAFGRSQAPDVPVRVPLGTQQMPPLRAPTLWPIPGKGPARAAVRGTLGDATATELVEVDTGVIAWRDKEHCPSIVGTTEDAVVCADANGVRALGLDGMLRWSSPASYLAFTGERIATSAGASELEILDAATGDALARVKLPAGVESDSVLATCGDAGREVFARGRDGSLQRVAEGHGGPILSWSVRLDAIMALDACDGDTVLVTTIVDNAPALAAIARGTGQLTGEVVPVTGWWPAIGAPGFLDISTTGRTLRYPRSLVAGTGTGTELPPLGELLDARGDRRLVRASPGTAAILDGSGVVGHIALADAGAVLGDHAILAGGAGTVRRALLPPPHRRTLRTLLAPHVVAVAAPLRDLPAPSEPTTIATAARAGDVGAVARAGDVGAVALAGDELFVATSGATPGADDRAGTVYRADLRRGGWDWNRLGACGPGEVRGVAVAATAVACATRGTHAIVHAVARADGTGDLWQWDGDNVDGLLAADDAVVVLDADRAIVLDAANGHALGTLASDDGGPARVAVAGARLYAIERGRLVARIPAAGLAPLWSLRVNGAVRALAPTGGGVLVTLEDGDAYRVDEDGSVVAVAGIGLAWSASDDLLVGGMLGDVIAQPMPTGIPPPAPAAHRWPLKPPVRVKPPEALADDAIGPPLSTPVVLPPPIGRAWQLGIFERSGAIRVRNDYALAEPVVVGLRGPGAPIVVAGKTADGTDALVLDPRTGDVESRAALPAGSVIVATPAGAFAVLAHPLTIVRF
jgi:hypothetical protein